MRIQSLFKVTSATFAIIPGLSIILTDVSLPPGISRILFGGIVEATGVSTLLLLNVSKEKILHYSNRQIVRITTVLMLSFLVSLFAYLYLYESLLVYNRQFDVAVFFPLWHTNELTYYIQLAGGKNEAITQFGPAAIRDVILLKPEYLIATKLLMGCNYILMLELLVISFGILGVKLSKNEDGLPDETI